MSDYLSLNELINVNSKMYSELQKEEIVYSNLKNASRKTLDFVPKDSSGVYYGDIICDNQNEYRKTINSLGYRSVEFSSGIESLFAGCSHTWGFGLPYDSMWPSIVSKNIGSSFNNIGFPGMSVSRIVQMIFSYCREFGNPKNIFVMFPNIDRFMLPKTTGFLENKNHRYTQICDLQLDYDYRTVKDKPKYFKTPLFLEEIVTEDIAIWSSLQSIQMLEQYCKSSGIRLIWASWQKDFNDLINIFKNNTYYFDHIDIKPEEWFQNEPYSEEKFTENDIDCHSELKNNNNTYYWNLGGDREAKSEGATPHFGAHRNIHIAEYFINKYREKNG
jgi:hypothetical protein